MTDQTPRTYRGTLLERAAAQYPFAPQGPLPVSQPVRSAPIAPMPACEPEGPMLRRTDAETPEPAPVFQSPQAAAEAEGRRTVPIDRTALADKGLLVPGGAITPLAEEFRMIKRQLLLTSRAIAAAETRKADQRARMVLVCSAQPGDGKTFCAVNLAISMASERDVEVLLVDADFAKPSIPDRLGIASGPGLLDALAGAVNSVEDCILDTDIPQLSILPAGKRTNSDTELLASERARAMLDGIAAANPRRIVIFDSPPALAASPASVLALHVGQVMLVVRADRTSESDLREAVKQLDGCEHIQLVLNSVSFQSGRNRFGSYYGEAGE